MAQASNNTATPSGTDKDVNSLDWARTVHRALRGRYRLTVLTALIVGAAGAAAGWRWAGPLFRSEGMVRIASALPTVVQATDQNQPIPMFDSFMQAQQGVITSRQVLEAAMKDPLWNAAPVSGRRPSVADLSSGLKVDVKPRSENLNISYNDSNPAVASAAVHSTIGAYEQQFDQANEQLEDQRLQLLEDYRNKLASQLDLAKGPANGATTQPVAAAAPPTPESIAMVDIGMRRLLDERDGIQDDLDRARIYYGENHIFVERERMSLEDANQRVQQYVNDYVGFRAGLAAMPPVASTAQTGAIPEAAAQAPPLSASMQQIQNQLDDADRRIDVLKTEAAMPKRLEVVTTGDFPVSVPGRQIKATLAAGTAGASLTVAFMVATGLLRRRYKYCSEITEALAEKTRFVAALPRLDDKNDLHQWHDAALCVHHLRQTLEHDSNVYLVTSADWSDGRTSTVMSLALSLSGAGIRTLVIDADLANRGLTRMLKLNDEPGFFELLDGKDFTASRISPNSLAIMPVGQASEADGLSISESVLSPLLARARASFDVVLIDAGPVLSRIETIEIARQVDGVLLTVPRGQHRSLVAQALRELELAQANVVGVIFNRVEPKDFYRSIKRRGSVSGPVSQPHPVPQALGEFGPLVRAVAMSLNKDVELSRIIGANRNTLVGGGPGRDKQVA